jgi:hypothetical protein
MPARRPHVTRCGDLETSCTDVLLYFAAVFCSSMAPVQNPNMYRTRPSSVGLRGFKLNPTLQAYMAEGASRRPVRRTARRLRRRVTRRQ